MLLYMYGCLAQVQLATSKHFWKWGILGNKYVANKSYYFKKSNNNSFKFPKTAAISLYY